MFRLINKSLSQSSTKHSFLRQLARCESHLAQKPAIYTPKTSEPLENLRRNERILFDKTYHKILNQLSSNPTFDGHYNSNELSVANEWFRRVIDYNVPKGKRNRGLMAVISYHLMATDDQKSPQMLDSVRALGWALELFQAYFLILDDIMDESITRRGQKCWYRQEGVGLIACNDATLIESGIYHLVKLHFKNKPYYMDIVELIQEVFRKTAYGQCLDMLSNPGNRRPDLNDYTFDKYSAIVKYKTSYYTCVMPVRLAMYLSDYNSAKDHQLVEQILLRMGHLFQARDDYLDCFGDSFITGKIGTDIEDGKCCWPIVTALEYCSQTQRQVLQTHYGSKDYESVKQIRQIYEDLGLDNMFNTYENHVFNEILEMIDKYKYEMDVPIAIFDEPLAQIYNRNK